MRWLLVFLFFLPVFPALAAPEQEPLELSVYTAVEPELLIPYARAFQEEYPGIRLRWIRESAGPLLAKIIAERDNPSADAVFGLSLPAVLALDQYGLLEPSVSDEIEAVALQLQDSRDEPVWTAVNAWGAALCVNTREAAKKKIPLPVSWRDLLQPIYKGRIVMSNPVSSSTALMNVNAWLQSMGWDEGWAYMEALDENIAMYVHSGCKPCQMAAMGEAVIGIASNACARVLLERKAPLEIVLPREGVGWDIEAAAVLKNGKNLEAAHKLVNFASSKAVARIAQDFGYIPARSDMQNQAALENLALFLPVNIEQFAADREKIIAEWRKRFEHRKNP